MFLVPASEKLDITVFVNISESGEVNAWRLQLFR